MSDASSSAPDVPVPVPQPASGATGPLKAWWVAPVAVLAVGFIYFASQVIGGIIIYLYPQFKHWTTAQSDNWITNSVFAQFFYILIAEALTMLGLYFMLKAYRWKWSTIGLTKPQLKQIGLGILVAVPYYVVYVIVVLVLSAFIPALKVDQKQEIGFDSVHGALALVLTFISLVILPPLVEEIAMRGFLFTSMRKWLPWFSSALIVSLLFGSAHLTEGGAAGPLWIGAIDTFILSIALCILREKTGNLWAGISLHATKNFVAFVSIFIFTTR